MLSLRIPLLTLILLGLSYPAQAADQAMQASLQAFFAKGIVLHGAQAELAEVTRWPDTHGKLNWHLPHLSQHPARLSLIAEQKKNGQLYRWFVPVKVHWWMQALTARHDIPARTRIDASQLVLKRIDMAGLNGHSWNNPASLNGTRTTRPLHAGQVILSSYITRPPLLKRGDQITLIAHIGGIRVTATGKVLRNAASGDRVRVQNLRSKEILQATVIDAHSARIESGGA